MLKKNEKMYHFFGKCEGKKCSDCCHLVISRYNGKNVRKCKVYGITGSEASDWRLRYDACGLFNKPTSVSDVMSAKDIRHVDSAIPVDGQIGFGEVEP